MRRAAYIVTTILLMAVIGSMLAAEHLSRPARRSVGGPPDRLQAEAVGFATESGQPVRGWFAQGLPGKGAVLLLHGLRSDRREMLSRSLVLNQAGFAVLLIDLPAHGESEGDRITFGHREAGGVTAALDYMAKRLPSERVGVIGVSLGAASLVFAQLRDPPSAVILEAMYPTISEAVENRLVMRFGVNGKHLAPLLLWQLPLRFGITQEDLRPIEALRSLRAPLLLISGSKDQHTTLPETRRLFQAANEPKDLWVVEGAAHVDLHAYDPAAYEARVIPFLARRLAHEA